MNSTIIYTIITLSFLGVLSATILYFIAKKFHVLEDPKIDKVEEVLPGANCGGCGYPGCRNFAEAVVKSGGDFSKFFCPVGGNECMAKVASVLGVTAEEKDPMIAVVRCNGSCEHRTKTNVYDGPASCALASYAYAGETDCSYGCLEFGDCVKACKFDALHMDKTTGLPVVDEEKCIACGACVGGCPKNIIEMRKKGPKSRRVFVSCVNKDKGPVAKKACAVACIGCTKCAQECPFDAITIENFLAYVDFEKCKLCRKCVSVCPTNAIHELNFPPRKETAEQKSEVKESNNE